MKNLSTSLFGSRQLPSADALTLQNKFKRTLVKLVGICVLLSVLIPGRSYAQLPSGWSGHAIGSSVFNDTYNSSTGTYVLTGTGAGQARPNFTEDNLHFVHKQVTGDVEIVARVVSASLPTINGQVKGQVGLMFRTNLVSGGPAATIQWWLGTDFWNYVTPPIFFTQGRWPYIPAPDGQWTGTSFKNIYPPFWLKLVRIGKNYGTYWSLDGQEWLLVANGMGGVFNPTGAFEVGLFVAGGANNSTTATFDHVSVGPPNLKYKTSWVGNSYGGAADDSVSNAIQALWVKPDDGTCYAVTAWNELTGAGKAYSGSTGKPLLIFAGAGLGNTQGGGVTGNSSNLFYVQAGYDPARVYRCNLDGSNQTPVVFTNPVGNITGIAASSTRLFVSDSYYNAGTGVSTGFVHIIDLSTLTETTGGFALDRAGPMAFDGTNFWIIQTAMDRYVGGNFSPLTRVYPGGYPYQAKIKCYSPTGTYQTGRDISDVISPTALAKDPTQPRLYVCENGPNQNVRHYTISGSGTPPLSGTLGIPGGIWAGAYPGLVYNPGSGYDQRFALPAGVGVDNSGNVYVASSAAGTDLRKFNSAGAMQWRSLGLEFINVGNFDPTTDGADIYTPEEHFKMNYANTAPGSEWSYYGMTRNPMIYPNDGRHTNTTARPPAWGAGGLRRLGPNNDLFMYTNEQGGADPVWMYRVTGEIARPFGKISHNNNYPTLWMDANGNNVEEAGEVVTDSAYRSMVNSFDVDTNGDIWIAFNYMQGFSQPSIRRMKCPSSMQTITGSGTPPFGGSMAVPAYSLTPGSGYQEYWAPSPINNLCSIKYDRPNDVMYLMGQKADGNWVLGCYDKWLASAPYDPPQRFLANLPVKGDITLLAPADTIYFQYFGLDVAGDKVFLSDLWGPVLVYDANLGNRVINLIPGAEVSASMGWDDMNMGVHAFKRSTGEYLVTEEEAGCFSNFLLYRWTPQGDSTAVPKAPTSLTAVATGKRIHLTWQGTYGVLAGYNLYRGTSPGSLTLYQSNITSASFNDLNVTAGTTYYYELTAVSAGGESAHSNQASAVPTVSDVDFVKYDTTTKGTWRTASPQVYGLDGYEIVGNTTSYPPYATVTMTNSSIYDATVTTTDVRGLQHATGTNRSAAWRWITAMPTGDTYWSWNVNLTDNKWHQVAVYAMDWSGTIYPRADVVDTATGTVLDSRSLADYSQGTWLVWNIRGNVQIRIYRALNGGGGAKAGGIFFSPVPQPTPNVAWWKFDETSGTIVGDSSGAGNNGAAVYGPTWTPSGKINGCISFNGGTPKVNLPTFLINDHRRMTIATWFKTSVEGPLIAYTNAPPTAPTKWVPVIYVGNDGKLRGTLYTGPGSETRVMASTSTVKDNAWHHAALVADDNFQILYLDGNIVSTMASPIVNAPHGSPTGMAYDYLASVYVAGWPGFSGATSHYPGMLDDMRIYDRPLSPSEIKALSGQ